MFLNVLCPRKALFFNLLYAYVYQDWENLYQNWEQLYHFWDAVIAYLGSTVSKMGEQVLWGMLCNIFGKIGSGAQGVSFPKMLFLEG